ncbi:MAG: hypothetical protein QG670_1093 [Thermoproteota archaeon]|nr:hypothetical protein [Thermoproteota archaeon]
MEIDAICNLRSFRAFMILSTCQSFIPPNLLEEERVFPERPKAEGTMYIEAEDKQTIQTIGEITFVRVSEVLGVIYNSKSGRTKLKWRNMKEGQGRLTGEASSNTLVNLFAVGALDRSYAENVRKEVSSKA